MEDMPDAHDQGGAHGKGGQEQEGQHVHEHIIAGEGAPERPLQEARAIADHDLEVAPGPAEALPPGLGKVLRLLVVEHRSGAEADPPAPEELIRGELDVLRQQVEGPGAQLLRHAAAKEEARAGNGAADAQEVAGMIQIAALPQKPEGGARAHPAGVVIDAVAVAGDDLEAGRKAPVHLLDVVRFQEIVCVEDEIAVEALGIVRPQTVQQGFQGVALSHMRRVPPGIDPRAPRPGGGLGAVSAVVRHDEDMELLPGVGLPL